MTPWEEHINWYKADMDKIKWLLYPVAIIAFIAIFSLCMIWI